MSGSSPFTSNGERAAHRMGGLRLWAPDATSAGEVVGQLLAIQSQEHGPARWSVAQRMRRPPAAATIDEAFDRGEFLRTHVLRPTWHYVSPGDLRWLVRFSGPRVAARAARYWHQFGLDAGALAASTDVIAGAVADGPLTRREIGERLSPKSGPLSPEELAARVMHAELHMAVCSGPMRGRQHTYAAFDERAGGDGPEGEEALATLAVRYFSSRGPATAEDFGWWAGLTAGEARRGFGFVADHLDTYEDDDGRRYAYGPPVRRSSKPAIDFIQCYDETIVSYRATRDVLKSPVVDFEPLRRIHGYTHVILRRGQLLGHWRPSRVGESIEVRLADSLSPSDEEPFRSQLESVRRFFVG